jgi:RNA polymerase sigma-70 factor (ECF subfamily)
MRYPFSYQISVQSFKPPKKLTDRQTRRRCLFFFQFSYFSIPILIALPVDVLHNRHEIFQRIAEGDEQAFTEAFLHYSRRLFPFVSKRLKCDRLAEEAMQEIFMKLWVNRHRLPTFENPEGWLYRVAANIVLDHFRRMAQQHKAMEKRRPAAVYSTAEAYADIDFRETRQKAEEAVQRLPAKRKAIYELRQQGMSYEEIGQRVHLSVNTIKNQLISANRFVRDFLLAQGISPVVIFLIDIFFLTR